MEGLPTRFGESTPRDLARLAGVSLRTARRWRATGHIPRPARVLIAVKLGWLELGVLSPAWSGWYLRRGELVSPDGWTFSAGELLALPFRYQQLRHAERELALERDELARARERAGRRA